MAFEAIQGPREPSQHIEEQIYNDFFSYTDEDLMEYFHSVPWEEHLDVVESFDDSRLREIGYRLIHSERPDLLDHATCQAHADRITRNLLGLDGEVPWLTLREAIEEANELLDAAEVPDLAHMHEHRDYLQRRLAQAMRQTL
jgi:exodeoxyribonuclease I